MIFVTTGQMIAVENFSKGVIYKVTFTDESISYMMCVGIGKDFVMLQSTDPLLFSLTMQSASRVSTIDVHDPTPPEPPTPIENALQYQTGEPPFTFTTTENSLFSWYIEGEAGVKTANLFDYKTAYSGYIASNGDVVATNTITAIRQNSLADFIGQQITISVYGKQLESSFLRLTAVINGTSVNGNIVYANTPDYMKLTVTPETADDYWRISYGTAGTNTLNQFMINTGSTALPYEPYGFKISISTNEHTTTIYLDEPIAEGEKLYSVNVDAQIVTDIGENTLSVSDPQPPEMQIVYGIYAEA